MLCLKEENTELCLRGEPDLALEMKRLRDPSLLKFVWNDWHDAVGGPGSPHKGRNAYSKLVEVMNEGARNNGK